MTAENTVLQAIGDRGAPVDWWFMYKIPSKSLVSDGTKATGTEYLYFDADAGSNQRLTLSPHLIDDPNRGALANTLNQIIGTDSPDRGWIFYNDEDPLTGKTNSNRGHAKGVLAFDLKSNSAFWLIHSTPKFSKQKIYDYPKTAVGNGQSFLCISLKDAEQANKIAEQMIIGQQPNVNIASKVPSKLEGRHDDARVKLLRDEVEHGHGPYADAIEIKSRCGKTFTSIAKNKHWNKAGDDDFYNDLVAIILKESIEVETWEHGVTPESRDTNSRHEVIAGKSVNLKSLPISPSYSWSEENDHSKIAISEKKEKSKFVCVGDLNFTVAQEKRSGGTVAFGSEALWRDLFEIISENTFRRK